MWFGTRVFNISPFIHILDKFLNIFQYALLSNFHCCVIALCCYNDLAFILNQAKLLYKPSYI